MKQNKPRVLLPHMLGLICLLLALCLSAGPGCGKKSVALDRDTRRAIDTLFAKQARVLRVELDSLCDAQFATLVQDAVDSMLVLRHQEIKNLRD